MSRSTFFMSNEPTARRLHQTSTTTTNESTARNNPRFQRNLRDKRRATGIRPDEVSLASSQPDDSTDEDEKTTVNESPMFTVSRVQPSFDKLSLGRSAPDSHLPPPSSTKHSNRFRPEEFILRRQPSDEQRTFEERLLTLESLVYEKDMIINDLQHRLDKANRDLVDAEQQIYTLHKEKLTLIKAFTSLQEPTEVTTVRTTAFLPSRNERVID